MTARSTPETAAAEVLAALDAHGTILPFTDRDPGFGLDDAYRTAAELRRLRSARGWRPAGRKLGFTNRLMWDEFGVRAPIWGDLWDRALADMPQGGARFAAASAVRPKIEPEIALGLARRPEPGMDDAALLGCLDFVAPGFELVQSVYPDWRFRAPDTVAAAALHAFYILGPRLAVRGSDPSALLAALEGGRATLLRNGETVAEGGSELILGGPIEGLRHLVAVLAADPTAPPLAPGEVVTTGSLTRAFDIVPGETWEARFGATGLAALRLSVT